MASRARIESNAWLRKQASGITGRVLSIGSGDDLDGEGGAYRDYFRAADAYFTSEPTGSHCDLQLDVRSMPQVPDGSFDAVFCSGVLEHVDDVDRACAEMIRVLRPGGTLLLGLPFRQAIHLAPTDYWRFTEHGIRVLLRRHGLLVEEIAAIDADDPAFPAAYWTRASRVGTAALPRPFEVNGFHDPADLAGCADDLDALRAFHPDLRALIDQPEIRHVRHWEYAALLRGVGPVLNGALVLDVGCGRSLLPAFLASRGARVTTVDLAEPLQEEREQRAFRERRGIRHVFGDMRALPFADASFDIVMSISAIEHLQETRGGVPRSYPVLVRETKHAMVEMARVVRDGGYLFVTSDLVDRSRQTDDAWRPGATVTCAYEYEDFWPAFVEPARAAGCVFDRPYRYDRDVVVRDPSRAIYRGRYFTTFGLLMRRSLPAVARERDPVLLPTA